MNQIQTILQPPLTPVIWIGKSAEPKRSYTTDDKPEFSKPTSDSVIQHIANNPGCSVANVSDALGASNRTMWKLMQELIVAGKLKREWEDGRGAHRSHFRYWDVQ